MYTAASLANVHGLVSDIEFFVEWQKVDKKKIKAAVPAKNKTADCRKTKPLKKNVRKTKLHVQLTPSATDTHCYNNAQQ